MSKIIEDTNGLGSTQFEAQALNSLKLACKDDKEEKAWVAALNSRNCHNLMALLKDHPHLWLITTSENRTVLHVAIMQGCVELVKLVLFGPPAKNGNRKVLPENAKVLLEAKDGKCRTNAFNLSAIVKNKEVDDILTLARQRKVLKPTHSSSSSKDEIGDLLEELASSDLYKSLQVLEKMKKDVDYNFENQQKRLIFNFACKRPYSNIDFLASIVTKAKEREISLQKLFTQMDGRGRTPLHVAVDHCRGIELRKGIPELLKLMPNECVNAPDSAGRTPLLRAVANGMSLEVSEVVKVLANDKRTNLNAIWPGESKATALHLAVLHGHEVSAKFLLEADREDSKECANVENQMNRRIKVFKQAYSVWTPLELAAIMGRHQVLATILAMCKQRHIPINDKRCLHLAAAAGDPQGIQALLMNQANDIQHFEVNDDFGGYSCLHFAVFAFLPHQRSPKGTKFVVKAIDEAFDRFLAFSDFASITWLEQKLTRAAKTDSPKLGMPILGYGSKKTCTTLLLQAGVDIWPSQEDEADSTNFTPTLPDPGSDAFDDDRLWWFELVAKETLKTKNNFNTAGNATAVVATLVATASFIGPLTPPLGYGLDDSNTWMLNHVQMESLPVRVFMASSSLSFYLAIASIMLAIMPSLPMPQESLWEELRRSRRTVALAISVLLSSILGLLVSFTSALIAVVPRHRYWSFIFYPTFVGGMFCSVILFLFFLRLLRLVFNKNARIRNFYHYFGIL